VSNESKNETVYGPDEARGTVQRAGHFSSNENGHPNERNAKMKNRKLWSVLATGVAVAVAAVGVAAAYPSSHTDADSSAGKSPAATKSSMPKISPQEAQRAVASAKDLSTAFRVAADRVLPSVVAIENRPEVTTAAHPRRGGGERDPFNGQNPFEGTPFGDLFRNMPRGQGFNFGEPPSPHGAFGMGSGVIIDSSGVILTNNHVVSGGGKVTVRLYDGREFTASSVATDPRTDIAIVKLDGAKDLVAAKMGDSESVAVGDWVLALGQPFGLESTVTAGIVSAMHRGIGITERENFLQTDAAINPGNSGGPLVNLDGEVIGINTAISSRSGGNDGVGFAVPISLAKWVAGQLSKDGTVQRAYLGIGIQPMNAALAQQFNMKPREGVVVTEVFPDTPAAKAGLKTGDVILSYAGEKVANPQELQLAVERSEIGKAYEVVVQRDGKNVELSFQPAKQPAKYGMAGSSTSDQEQNGQESGFAALGMEVGELNANVAEQLGVKETKGVVITNVEPGSAADRAGLESGMVISQVNRKPVTSVDEFKAAVQGKKSGESILLLVRTAQGSRFVVLNS
jgi:serine protease Do